MQTCLPKKRKKLTNANLEYKNLITLHVLEPLDGYQKQNFKKLSRLLLSYEKGKRIEH